MRVELNRIIDFATTQLAADKQMVLVTIVKTMGSSYRKMGVQMIVNEDLEYVGAISGGCVEKAVLHESQVVFAKKQNVLFEYDGQYKLGCNGTIYILIEYLDSFMVKELLEYYQYSQARRRSIYLHIERTTDDRRASTAFEINGRVIRNSLLEENYHYESKSKIEITPQQQLVIVGGEHDSVSLASFAQQVGFSVVLVVKESFRYTLPESVQVFYAHPEELVHRVGFDEHTAIVLMTHSLSKDLSFLQQLVSKPSFYLGALGPKSRKQTLVGNLLDMYEDTFLQYADKIEEMHGPVGLSIGAQTPEEIAISIISEIIAKYSQGHASVVINGEPVESFAD